MSEYNTPNYGQPVKSKLHDIHEKLRSNVGEFRHTIIDHPNRSIALGSAGLLLLGSVVAVNYDMQQPMIEQARQTDALTYGETPIQAAQTAYETLVEKSGDFGISANDVTGAALNAKLGNPVQPQNIDVVLGHSPIFHIPQVEVVHTPDEK